MPTKQNIKGMQNVRTHSSIAALSDEPYKAYLRMGALEMEKFRRGRERDSALSRVSVIEKRFAEIETEEKELLIRLDEKTVLRRARRPASRGEPPPVQRDEETGFKIKY